MLKFKIKQKEKVDNKNNTKIEQNQTERVICGDPFCSTRSLAARSSSRKFLMRCTTPAFLRKTKLEKR